MLGYVAKDTPGTASETIPTMIELLDARNDQLRGNAVGVLADLSEAYAEELVYDGSVEILSELQI